MTERLYIKVDESSVHIGHPRFESNMRQVMPSYDFDQGPPDGFMLFERVEPPILGVYEKFDETVGGNIALAFTHNGLSYDIVDGVYKDVWHVLPMTDAEKLAKQDAVKTAFADAHPTWASWSFDEDTCAMVPPVALPDTDNIYGWAETSQTWVIMPDDGQMHVWDEATETWTVVTPPE